MPRVDAVSKLCCSGLSTSGRNQAELSQQKEYLPQLAKSFVSDTSAMPLPHSTISYLSYQMIIMVQNPGFAE